VNGVWVSDVDAKAIAAELTRRGHVPEECVIATSPRLLDDGRRWVRVALPDRYKLTVIYQGDR
jgi:hypothetical protein